MNRRTLSLSALLACFILPATAFAQGGSAIPEMLKRYEAAGAHDFTAKGVDKLWTKEVIAKDGKPRSCSTCHGTDLTQPGRHVRSGKRIEPMAVSVNPKRFTKPKKIRKWFRRNCKWTWGRECTPQEKGNFLLFFQNQ